MQEIRNCEVCLVSKLSDKQAAKGRYTSPSGGVPRSRPRDGMASLSMRQHLKSVAAWLSSGDFSSRNSKAQHKQELKLLEEVHWKAGNVLVNRAQTLPRRFLMRHQYIHSTCILKRLRQDTVDVKESLMSFQIELKDFVHSLTVVREHPHLLKQENHTQHFMEFGEIEESSKSHFTPAPRKSQSPTRSTRRKKSTHKRQKSPVASRRPKSAVSTRRATSTLPAPPSHSARTEGLPLSTSKSKPPLVRIPSVPPTPESDTTNAPLDFNSYIALSMKQEESASPMTTPMRPQSATPTRLHRQRIIHVEDPSLKRRSKTSRTPSPAQVISARYSVTGRSSVQQRSPSSFSRSSSPAISKETSRMDARPQSATVRRRHSHTASPGEGLLYKMTSSTDREQFDPAVQSTETLHVETSMPRLRGGRAPERFRRSQLRGNSSRRAQSAMSMTDGLRRERISVEVHPPFGRGIRTRLSVTNFHINDDGKIAAHFEPQ